MIGLSLIPGIVYVFFGWVFDILLPALLWYLFLIIVSLYGFYVYKAFDRQKMNEIELKRWYQHLRLFMYTIFFSWAIIFALNIQHDEYNLHYIAIFTQLGASVVASALLVSDKKLFVPILLTLMLPLSLYFFLIGTWFGYVLSGFSLIFVGVLLYAAFNTHKLIEDNYYHAQHDILTGLYNRRYFMEYMEPLNERLKEQNKVVYLYLIDLDHFKTINDSLGHEVGDKLLVEVAHRIKEHSKNTHLVVRLGGDEFVLVSRELEKEAASKEKAYDFAKELLSVIREGYIFGKHHLHISASIGVHELQDVVLDTGNFIKEVDIAMYEAKSKGRDGIIIFNEDLSQRVERHLEIEQKLYKTLNGNNLQVYYQPQFDMDTNLVGCEALVRWSDEELGVLAPDEFIPIAESTGLILELGSYVLREAFKVLHYWNEEGKYLKTFSMNISIRQLLHEAFIEEVEVLCKYYFENMKVKQTIIFEITEHVFAENMVKVVDTMQRLRKSGISFSIDDFGTGYSSLSYLQVLPIDEVKIDKSFVVQIDKNLKSESMISTIISIAKNFDLKIVVEGVETKEQFEKLKVYQCDIYQGFYFDEALPQVEFEQKYLTT